MTTSCTSSLSDRHVLWLLFLSVMPSYQSLIVLLFFRRVVAVRAFARSAPCIFPVIYRRSNQIRPSRTSLLQPFEILRAIQVPDRHRLLPRKVAFFQTPACLSEHARRAPIHARKHTGVRCAHSDQSVAAILGRKDHRIETAAQNVCRFGQMLGGHAGTIGADDEDRPIRRRDRGVHAGAEVAFALASKPNAVADRKLAEDWMACIRCCPESDGSGGCL